MAFEPKCVSLALCHGLEAKELDGIVDLSHAYRGRTPFDLFPIQVVCEHFDEGWIQRNGVFSTTVKTEIVEKYKFCWKTAPGWRRAN
jgi:hypothetical protein